jgi:hypothetical protein
MAPIDSEKAEEMRKRDAEKLNARKKKFDAARFAHIEETNQKHGQPTVVPSSAVNSNNNNKETIQEKNKRKGWGIFSKKKNNNNNAEDATTTTTVTKVVKSPPPIAARSVKPANVPQPVSAGWASVDKQNERTLPVVHSSEPNYPRPPELSSSTTTSSTTTNDKKSNRPKTPEKPIYKTVGYGTTTTTNGNNNNNNNTVSSTITNFGGSIKTKMGNPRQMKQPKVSSSTSESMDNNGNITRTITRKIKDPSTGKITTETEIIEIPASKK